MMNQMTVWDTFKERGFFKQSTNEDAVRALHEVVAYAGFDPTPED